MPNRHPTPMDKAQSAIHSIANITVQAALAQALRQGLARIDAQMLLLHTLGRPTDERAWLITHDSDPLPPAAQQRFEALCSRRLDGEPVAYLTGAIVNTGSIAGLRGFTCACAYVASKHAVNGLTKAIALEYAHKGIRCNSVNPCGSGTPMTDRCNGDYMEKLKKVAADGGDPAAFADEWLGIGKLLSPMERNATAEEQAAAILFLLSDDASFITGALLPVEGGWCVY